MSNQGIGDLLTVEKCARNQEVCEGVRLRFVRCASAAQFGECCLSGIRISRFDSNDVFAAIASRRLRDGAEI